MPLDPNVANLLQFIAASGAGEISAGTVEQARAGIRMLMVDFRDPSTLAEVGSITDSTIGDVPVRVYRPVGDGPFPTLVYFHGGGFVIGDLDTHEGVCRQQCRDVGAVVVSVDYRLAPEHRFPAAVDDCYSVLQHVAAHIDEFGGAAAKIAVGGDSAGGNLAAVCAQKAFADGLPLAAQLLVYPAVDMAGDYPSREENATGYFLTAADMEWFVSHYLGLDGSVANVADDPVAQELARDPRLSPLHAESLVGLAPAVVATAEFDPLRDEGNAYAAALEKAGVQVAHQQFAGLIHGFYGMELISPTIAAATEWINGELKTLLA